MIFKKIFKTVLLTVGLMALGTKVSLAQYYGGDSESAQLILDKKVRWVPAGESLDNIDKSVKVFYENDTIEYSIMVRNSGNTILSNIELRDYLPGYISLMFYPGDFDADKNEISWKTDELKPGEEKTYLIRGNIDETVNLDANSIVQLTNKAEAKTENINDSDTASYFIGGASIPETGDMGMFLKSGMILSTAATGWFLRKYARGY